jgi:hypothetical protein
MLTVNVVVAKSFRKSYFIKITKIYIVNYQAHYKYNRFKAHIYT